MVELQFGSVPRLAHITLSFTDPDQARRRHNELGYFLDGAPATIESLIISLTRPERWIKPKNLDTRLRGLRAILVYLAGAGPATSPPRQRGGTAAEAARAGDRLAAVQVPSPPAPAGDGGRRVFLFKNWQAQEYGGFWGWKMVKEQECPWSEEDKKVQHGCHRDHGRRLRDYDGMSEAACDQGDGVRWRQRETTIRVGGSPASVGRISEEIPVTAGRSHEPTAVIVALAVFEEGSIGHRPPPAGTFLFGRRTQPDQVEEGPDPPPGRHISSPTVAALPCSSRLQERIRSGWPRSMTPPAHCAHPVEGTREPRWIFAPAPPSARYDHGLAGAVSSRCPRLHLTSSRTAPA
ncbi:hypothetical protein E2562_017648 [Oryza meyeriana var. granulata]|uniref:Uncharacterized protein n=1 Tax=Oryza meyeriana var. granulata TaxID=110450 RepID=A0A6G1BXG4_9ORYZ|nr:hypothetical protein E2562_017648 [Oryza meyeriana var. granulata]